DEPDGVPTRQKQ
nr:RecName: Full=Pseudohemocyanin [Liocarcinus marmoreus]